MDRLLISFLDGPTVKILLASDGSPCSARAARYVATNFAHLGRKPDVLLLHVDPPLLERIDDHVAPEDIARFHSSNARVALRSARRLFDRGKIPYRQQALVGDPASTIAAVARKDRAELIVMGSHGRGALTALLLGSVVQKVLALTKIPVLVVR